MSELEPLLDLLVSDTETFAAGARIQRRLNRPDLLPLHRLAGDIDAAEKERTNIDRKVRVMYMAWQEQPGDTDPQHQRQRAQKVSNLIAFLKRYTQSVARIDGWMGAVGARGYHAQTLDMLAPFLETDIRAVRRGYNNLMIFERTHWAALYDHYGVDDRVE